jgi:uracil-DNA glycosylase
VNDRRRRVPPEELPPESEPDANSGAEPYLPAERDLPHLARAAASCKGCALWEPATQVVFGEGPDDADLVLVGEQPGDHEDIEGVPFVGPAGHVLDQALEAAGIDRERIYLTNAVKHFRFEARGPRRLHKTPTRWEIVACRPWLSAELAALTPKVLVLMGAVAAHALLGNDFSVTKQRGLVPGDPTGFTTVATVHPSSILRVPHELRERQLAAFVDDLRLAARLVAG